MRAVRSFVIPGQRQDLKTATTPVLQVAGYEYFKNPQSADEKMLKAHKTELWQEICLQSGWILVDAYLDMLEADGKPYKGRLEFERLLQDCAMGNIDMIVTHSINRFCTDAQTCLETVRMLATLDHKVDVLFLQEGIHCSGDKNLGLLELLSEYEKNKAS